MAQRLSIRAYARHRGCHEKTVRNALEAGRIQKEPDGKTIDPEKADAQWAANTGAPRRGKSAKGRVQDSEKENGKSRPEEGDEAVDAAYQTRRAQERARAAKLKAEAELAELALQERKGELISKAVAATAVYEWFRRERDVWQAWPARVSGLMAAELQIEHRVMNTVLEKHVRQHLRELATVERPDFSG